MAAAANDPTRPEFSATSETLPSAPRPPEGAEVGTAGSSAGRYDPRDELGAGGMGTVHRMHDRALGRDVALKRIHADHDSARERFLREARVTGRLEHPGIVPVYDLGHDDAGKPFYTMRIVRGRTLGALLDDLRDGADRPLLVERLEIFVRACDAVAYAHAHGVIHRDLKPDNIMTGDFGQVLVVDWGLARVLTETDPAPSSEGHAAEIGSGSQTMEGMVLGTPAYMPPEQAFGDLVRTDARSDIYSLGATLYEILTLDAPFEGDTVERVLTDVQAGRFVPPRERTPDAKIPPGLEAVVLRAMAHDPEDRFATVAELQHAVRESDVGSRARAEFDLRRMTPDLAGAAMIGLFRTNALLARAIQQRNADTDLTPPQTNLLRIVHGAIDEGATRDELWRKEVLADYATDANLAALVERGLIRAEPEGATTRYRVTEPGAELAERLLERDPEMMELLSDAGLTDADWRTLAELLERIRAGTLGSFAEPPPEG